MKILLWLIAAGVVVFVLFLWAGWNTLEEDYRKRGIKR